MELFFKYLLSTTEKKAVDKSYGVGIQIRFPNNFGASIIRDDHSYGGIDGNYEIAVLYNGNIHYDNPVACGDIIGHVMPHKVEGILLQIKGLDDPYGFEASEPDKVASNISLKGDLAACQVGNVNLERELEELNDKYKEGYTLIQWPESQEYHDIDEYPDCIVANEDGYGNKGNGPGGTFVPNKYLCKE